MTNLYFVFLILLKNNTLHYFFLYFVVECVHFFVAKRVNFLLIFKYIYIGCVNLKMGNRSDILEGIFSKFQKLIF